MHVTQFGMLHVMTLHQFKLSLRLIALLEFSLFVCVYRNCLGEGENKISERI